ncbi:transglutaminase-like domain-containing protein [Paenibacillus sp. R14(2021)]|uniref:transglutaminase-like domain-containing protein n=1 Tax=Paenibacillus sp. R14(2021) TaxID=2859228 RepID=UPI001C6140F8|nr:transglutaminase-like domain-containing protein [Paenibacillus sp. R14(2021)]
MILLCESSFLGDYLAETEEIDYSHPHIQKHASELFAASSSENDFVSKAFTFVCQQIGLSADHASSAMTSKASEALLHGEGSGSSRLNVLCGILRSKGIPSGFCYPSAVRGTAGEGGEGHALNAVFLKSANRWVLLDASGNQTGAQAIATGGLTGAVRSGSSEVSVSEILTLPRTSTTPTFPKAQIA